MMKYKTTGQITPIKDAEFRERIREIHDAFSEIVTTGQVSSFDGISLQYYYYLCENPIGNIVIIHGFTEFALKYEEIIYYFLELF